MEFSSPRFKALAVTFGSSVWFFLISSAAGIFSLKALVLFVLIALVLTQVFSKKLSTALDSFAIFNTKLFLGILFVTVVSLYGILFKILKIDLLRLKKQSKTYWLEREELESRILKQY